MLVKKRIVHENIPNNTICWRYLRQQVHMTSTEMVEFMGVGYNSWQHYIRVNFFGVPHYKTNAFMKRLFIKGNIGEQLAMEKFCNTYKDLECIEPVFTEIKYDYFLQEKYTSNNMPQYIQLKNIRIGCSTDGFICNKYMERIGVIEVKTITTNDHEIIFDEKIIKFRWIIQVIIECIITNTSFGILIMYNYITGEYMPVMVLVSLKLKEIFLEFFNFRLSQLYYMIEQSLLIKTNNNMFKLIDTLRIRFKRDARYNEKNFKDSIQKHLLIRKFPSIRGNMTSVLEDMFSNTLPMYILRSNNKITYELGGQDTDLNNIYNKLLNLFQT
jgi:hypothetical protein